MAVMYTLELFPTSKESEDLYKAWLGGTEATLNGDNAGVDLFCVKDQLVNVGFQATLLDLGVKARMIKHWAHDVPGGVVHNKAPCHFWLAPRSSIWKSRVRMANGIGIIDKGYRGVLLGAVVSEAYELTISAGSRLFQVLAPDMGDITQVVLRPLSELDETARGEGGFGSTGK
jgi:dUTPase